MRGPLGRIAVGLGLIAAAAGCGDETDRPAAPPPPSSASPASTTPKSVTPSTPPSVPAIAVACGERHTAESRGLVSRQKLAFYGTVVRTTLERNPDAAYRTAFLDDGLEDPGVPPDESAVGDPDAGELWPWTTFAVNGWFTTDFGTRSRSGPPGSTSTSATGC